MGIGEVFGDPQGSEEFDVKHSTCLVHLYKKQKGLLLLSQCKQTYSGTCLSGDFLRAGEN
jgi:hypothetical protein